MRKSATVFIGLIVVLGPLVQLGVVDGPGTRDASEPSGTIVQDATPYPEVDLRGLGGHFTENRGQFDPSVEFLCQGAPLSVAFGRGCVEYVLTSTDSGLAATRFRVDFEGCRPVAPAGVGQLPHATNYVRGASSDGWVFGAHSFSEVLYTDLWDGIDLRYYLTDGKLKYDVIVSPGADPDDVRFGYDGVEGLEVDSATGDLLVRTACGTLRENAPVAFQGAAGVRTDVRCDFRLSPGPTVGFLVGAHDASAVLTIDPGLEFSTFFGGSGDEECYDMCLDDEDNIYVLGTTYSTDFPATEGAFSESNFGDKDAFVCEFSPDGTSLVFSTYIGGSNSDYAFALQLRDGKLIITGATYSADLPVTSDALDPTYNGGGDGYVLVLDGQGTSVQYCSYIGGDKLDTMYSCLGADGSLYLVGNTNSTDLPTTPGSYYPTQDGTGLLFVMKLDPTLKTIEYCTYINVSAGGSSIGYAFEDSEGALVIAGLTAVKNIGWPGLGFCNTCPSNAYCGILLRLDQTGSTILNWTYLGGYQLNYIYDMIPGKDGTIIVVGETFSMDFPLTVDAIDDDKGINGEGFITVLSGDLSTLVFSTYYGGNALDDYIWACCLDPDSDMLYLCGSTNASDMKTTPGAFDTRLRWEWDCFIASIDMGAKTVEYSTFLGGEDAEWCRAIALRSSGELVIVGHSESDDFPTTPDAMKRTIDGYTDCTLLRFEPTAYVLEPDPPTDVRAVAGDRNANISWDAPSNVGVRVQKHIIYRGLDPGNLTKYHEVQWGDDYYVDDDLYAGRYYYKVSAVNSVGEGPASEVVSCSPTGPPREVANLTARTGDGAINLTWDPPRGLEGATLTYTVLRGESRTTMAVLESGLTERTYRDTYAKLGTFYYYQVQAVNTYGPGLLSDFVHVKALNVPTSPTALTVTPMDNSVRLSWGIPSNDGASMILGYRVYRGTGPGDMALIATVSQFVINFLDAEVINGRSYIYYVTAFTEVGESVASVAMDVVPFGKPLPVQDLTATGADESVLLTWLPPTYSNGRPITKHTIRWGTDEGDLTNELEVGNVTSFNHSGLDNGVTYHYQVLPRNEAGDGPASPVVSATPMGPPGAVMGLAATSTASGVRLTWVAPGDTGGATSLLFRVLRDTAGDPVDAVAEVSDATEWLDTDAARGQTYHYRVVAVNDAGEGPRGTPVSVTVTFVPGRVTGLVATAGDGEVALCWTAPDDGGAPILRYIIKRGLFVDALAEVGQADGAATNFTDATVDNGKTYHYAVRAVNAMGAGPDSATASATPQSPPGGVGLFKAKVDKGAVTLTWAAPAVGGRASVTGYVVLRGTSPTDLAVLASLGDVLTYTDDTVEEGKTYYYVVRATSGVGDGEPVAAVEVKVPKEKGDDGPGFAAAATLAGLLAAVLLATRRRAG